MAAGGLAAGGINAVIGSGSLITFPTLLALGYAPVTANVSNNIGLVPGSFSSVYGYRRELVGQRARVLRMGAGSASGSLVGAVLLLTTPSDVFDAVIPILVLTACVLMALQPRLAAWVAGRRTEDAAEVGWAPIGIAFAAGVYGGYFGAAQGVILLATLAVFVPDDLKRSNALKNVLAGTVNTLAAIVFILFAHVAWEVVALIGTGSVVGGALGARVGRRIPAPLLRALVVVLGVGVAVRLLLT